MTCRTVQIRSAEVLASGFNGRGEWRMRKLVLDGHGFDVVTFDDRVPDEGEVRVRVRELTPRLGRRQFRVWSVS